MKPPILLRIYLKNKLIDVKQFKSDQVVIGANNEAQVCLVGDSVSPLHALIEERDEGHYISDLGSSSGTLKNGKKVLDEKINSNDSIEIGDYKIEFFIGVPKPVAPPKINENAENETVEKELKIPIENEAKTVVSSALKSKLKTFIKGNKKSTEPPKMPGSGPEHSEDDPLVTEPSEDSEVKDILLSSEFGKKSFAPNSINKELPEIVGVGEGDLVEVIVAWQERVIGTYIFRTKGTVSIGTNRECEIRVPIMGDAPAIRLLTISDSVIVYADVDTSGHIISKDNSKRPFAELRAKSGAGSNPIDMTLNQGELIHLKLPGGSIEVIVRFTKPTQKPIAAPFLDFSATEVTSLVLAGLVGVLFSFYMFVVSPDIDEETLVEERIRRAVVTFSPPKVPIVVPVKQEQKQATSQGKKSENKQNITKKDPGKAASVAAPKKPKRKKSKRTPVATRSGGSKKTSRRTGKSAKSVKKDVSKTGLLGALSGGGIREKLNQASSGSGELMGIAEGSSGASGFASNRAGKGVGSSLKQATSGSGASTIGIGAIGTKGRGTGNRGSGSGGFGSKGKVNVNFGGEEAFFEGSVDRDAVRRVIQQNKRSIQHCYTRERTRNSSVFGKVSIKWTVVEGGKVKKIKVSSNSTNSNRLGACVMRRIAGLRFPEPPGDQEYIVEYPFVFAAQ